MTQIRFFHLQMLHVCIKIMSQVHRVAYFLTFMQKILLNLISQFPIGHNKSNFGI